MLSRTPHARCGWIGPDTWLEGVASFAANADWFDAIHPQWYELGADAASIVPLSTADALEVVDTATAHGVPVIPLVARHEADHIRDMINDATRRAAHVENLVDLAVGQDYAGLEIDYEKLWDAADRPGFVAFITELTTAMHAAGKEVSMAINGLAYDTGDSAYDYTALSAVLDRLHIMGYDFHHVGANHAGPTAPLGWIEAVCAFAAATSQGERFSLGLPNYGIGRIGVDYGAGHNTYCVLGGCATECSGSPTIITDDGLTVREMATCTLNTDNHYPGGRYLYCATDDPGNRYFDDLTSLEEKVQAAQAHGLGGVTYWNLGSELEGFFDMLKTYFP